MVSSKECVEDLFGKGADLKHANKNPFKAGSTERFHFNNSHWIRLPGDEWPKLMIERDDVTTVQNQPRRTHVNLGTSAPNGHTLKTIRTANLKNSDVCLGLYDGPKNGVRRQLTPCLLAVILRLRETHFLQLRGLYGVAGNLFFRIQGSFWGFGQV